MVVILLMAHNGGARPVKDFGAIHYQPTLNWMRATTLN